LSSFSLVIPVKNEIENVKHLGPYLELVDEVIFVDGGSTDGTFDWLRKHLPEHYVTKQRGSGKGAAIVSGIELSTSQFTFVLDADRPISVAELRQAIEIFKVNIKVDLIKASRHIEGGGSDDLTLIRNFGARFLALIARIIYGVTWTEVCYGFWGIRTQEAQKLLKDFFPGRNSGRLLFRKIPYAHSFEFDQYLFLQALKQGLSIVEIPSYEMSRQNGQSSLNAFKDGLRTLIVLIRERINEE
jgi:glycosyltransferase involved in cell wall biosynthesis